MKRLVRGALIAAALILTLWTIGAVEATGAAAWPWVAADVAVLLLALRAAGIAARRTSRQG